MGSGVPRPGARHWAFQALPPLVMLLPLFATEHGTAFVYLAGFFIIPVLISLLSVLFKLIAFGRRKYFLLRPLLTIGLFALLMAIAHWTYEDALEEAVNAARSIHEQCNANAVCPEQPDGWARQGRRIHRGDLGAWFKYSASYIYREAGFEIRVYQGPDLGHFISGGIGLPLDVTVYVEQ